MGECRITFQGISSLAQTYFKCSLTTRLDDVEKLRKYSVKVMNVVRATLSLRLYDFEVVDHPASESLNYWNYDGVSHLTVHLRARDGELKF